MYFMEISMMGYKSIQGDREDEDEYEDVSMGEEALQGVVNGQFISAQQDGYPVVTNVSGYPEARSKLQVRDGEEQRFRVLVVKKNEHGALSVGAIVTDSLPLGSCWATTPESTGKVFFLNSRRGNLFNGQELLVFHKHDDEPARSDEDAEGRSEEPTHTYNHHGEDFMAQEGDVIEVAVDLKSEEGSLRFAVNGLAMPNSIVGIRGALAAATERKDENSDDDEENRPGGLEQQGESSFQLVVQVSTARDIVRLLEE